MSTSRRFKLGDYIDIETGVKKIGQTSFTLEHKFFKKESEDGERVLAARGGDNGSVIL